MAQSAGFENDLNDADANFALASVETPHSTTEQKET